jgi:hypothetical protein
VQALEFYVAVRGKRALVAGRKQRADISAGIGGNERRSVVELDGIVGIDRPPIQPEDVLLRCKGNGLGGVGADAQILVVSWFPGKRPNERGGRDRGGGADDDPGISGRLEIGAERVAVEIAVTETVVG